jgi:acetylornithine deacetylase/succinyl-diaminopimelate desuccinylase-like protein
MPGGTGQGARAIQQERAREAAWIDRGDPRICCRERASKGARAILLLAHIDAVEAQRDDWVPDPSTVIVENGYFCGRGTSDN